MKRRPTRTPPAKSRSPLQLPFWSCCWCSRKLSSSIRRPGDHINGTVRARGGGVLVKHTGTSINIYDELGLYDVGRTRGEERHLGCRICGSLRDRGKQGHEVIQEAAMTRLRPVVMTMLSTVFGALPLILSVPEVRKRAALLDGYSSATPLSQRYLRSP